MWNRARVYVEQWVSCQPPDLGVSNVYPVLADVTSCLLHTTNRLAGLTVARLQRWA